MLRPVTKKEKIKAEASIRMVKGNPDTICEHIRVVFRIAESKIENRGTRSRIMEECRVILAYAKRMNARLVEHHQKKEERSA